LIGGVFWVIDDGQNVVWDRFGYSNDFVLLNLNNLVSDWHLTHSYCFKNRSIHLNSPYHFKNYPNSNTVTNSLDFLSLI
jgi:hypothetical protein